MTKHPDPEPTPTATDPTDQLLRGFIGYQLKRAYMVIQAAVAEILEEHDLKVTGFSALAIIIENPGLTQTALAQALKIERSSVVVIVDTLENRDLITRNKVETDRRQYALMPTLRGRRLFDRLAAAIQHRERGLIAKMNDDEQQILTEGLRAIERAGRRSSDT